MKRVIAAGLWFISTLCMYELLVSVGDAPRIVGPLLGLVAAAFVLVDPLQRFWNGQAAPAENGSPLRTATHRS
jgi:hypothetical protein